MFCPECGKAIPDQSRFCLSCGHSLEAIMALSGRQDTRVFAVQPSRIERTGDSQAPEDPLAERPASKSDESLHPPVCSCETRPPRTVTTIDDSLQILADRDLNSGVLVSLPSGTDVKLGRTSTVEGREWIQATLMDGRSGFVLAPSARGHTTLPSERTILAGMAMDHGKTAPSPASASSWLSDIFKGVRLTAGGLLMLIGVIGGLGALSGARGWTSGPSAWFSVLLFIGSGIAIWVSEKAEPLGGRQYRWGSYVGMMSGIGAAALFLGILGEGALLSGRFGVGGEFAIVFGLIFCVPYAVASLGVLRRRRFGVVTFLAMWTLTVFGMFTPFFSLGPRSADARIRVIILALAALLVLVVPNYWYFAKRWKFMSSASVGDAIADREGTAGKELGHGSHGGQ